MIHKAIVIGLTALALITSGLIVYSKQAPSIPLAPQFQRSLVFGKRAFGLAISEGALGMSYVSPFSPSWEINPWELAYMPISILAPEIDKFCIIPEFSMVTWRGVAISTLFSRNSTMMALGLPLWMLFTVFAAYPAWRMIRFAYLWQKARHPEGHCKHCGYDLRGTESAQCPECGQVKKQPSTDAWHDRHRQTQPVIRNDAFNRRWTQMDADNGKGGVVLAASICVYLGFIFFRVPENRTRTSSTHRQNAKCARSQTRRRSHQTPKGSQPAAQGCTPKADYPGDRPASPLQR